MKREFLASVAVALWATQPGRTKRIGTALPAGKRLQSAASVPALILVLIASWAHPASAISLHEVLRTTLDNNPAILEAKAGLEQAAGQRLVFRSIVWPDFDVLLPAGLQYGHRAGENGVKGFAVGRGNLEQTLFNMAVPPSLRRGDIEVLIAEQQLNVAVVEQLHAARLAFYTALYNRSLESIRDEQLKKIQENVDTQKNRFEAGLVDRSALTSATIQTVELIPQIEGAQRGYREAQLNLAQAMGIDPAKSSLPEPDGELQFVPMQIDVAAETAGALAGIDKQDTGFHWLRSSRKSGIHLACH
jgi:outer membrane protein TolC